MGPSPVDRARNGSKHHLLVDATGIPLAWTVKGGNRNDVTQLVPLVERLPPVRGKVGRPWRRLLIVTADRGYDHDKYRRQLRQLGIKPEIARRQTERGSGLGRYRPPSKIRRTTATTPRPTVSRVTTPTNKSANTTTGAPPSRSPLACVTTIPATPIRMWTG